MKHLLVFLASAFLDVMWAIYIKKVGQAKPLGAATVTAFIYVFGAYVIIQYVRDGWYITSATAGACIGTYFATKYIK